MLGKVDDLVAVVESLPCNVFDKAKAAEWRRAKAGFDARHDVVGNATQDLIDSSFRSDTRFQKAGLPSSDRPYQGNAKDRTKETIMYPPQQQDLIACQARLHMGNPNVGVYCC